MKQIIVFFAAAKVALYDKLHQSDVLPDKRIHGVRIASLGPANRIVQAFVAFLRHARFAAGTLAAAKRLHMRTDVPQWMRE